MNQVSEDGPAPAHLDIFILAASADERTAEALGHLARSSTRIGRLVVVRFHERYSGPELDLSDFMRASSEIVYVECSITSPEIFGASLRENVRVPSPESRIGVDITAFTCPFIFVLLKYFSLSAITFPIHIFYSEPESYIFSDGHFKSFHSTSGPLKVLEVPGFPGDHVGNERTLLILLLGFDGELSSIVVEDVSPDATAIVNGFPGFWPKYKDVSLINNERIVESSLHRLQASAENPFEVFNVLKTYHQTLSEGTAINLAALGSKPMILGAAMFAVQHQEIRVVFPLPETYSENTTSKTWRTHCYLVPMNWRDDAIAD